MGFTTHPLYILAVLCIIIVAGEWLATKKYFHHIGTSLIVIILTAVVANMRLLPSSGTVTPVYDGIFTYIAPIAIFFLMLDVKLSSLKYAGLPMLLLFLLGAAGTIAGVVAGYYFLSPGKLTGDFSHALAGMYTGTYTGGSINFNAVALHYNLSKQGNLYAAATAVDNIMSAVWIIVTLTLPRVLQRRIKRKYIQSNKGTGETQQLLQQQQNDDEQVNPKAIAVLLGIGCLSIFLADALQQVFPKIPSVLTLTTIALLLAQIPWIQKQKGSKVLGLFSVYLFLAVIGAYCDIQALLHDGRLALVLLAWVIITLLVHGIMIFGAGALFKQDWDMIAIASQANIGGATTAIANARSLNRMDLYLPAILAGSLGSAIGTYLGFLVAFTFE